ncbi:hypothetical protein KAW18_12835 [candidate division WOR-3 bacterium]|nr:hypothetical protein [candidate division WOR-3 bacterium]
MKLEYYFKIKQEHFDSIKNILDRWKTVKCELSPVFGLDYNFILLEKYSNIRKYQDFNYAVEHLTKYHCWDVWGRVMDSFNNLNNSASKTLNVLYETISNRLNEESFTSGIHIDIDLSLTLDQLVKILIEIANSGENQGCDEYIHIEAQEKWAQVKDTGSILAEKGSMQDLETFKRIICGFITNVHTQREIKDLYMQFENIKKDIRTFTDQLTPITDHIYKLKGKCKKCPHILWVFSP